ncbi:MAG: ATP-dependent ligase clustered with Ku protein LigD [Verrucomicrobiaceae bacterium]|nr:ATP-dependent ligase clustered with Ku protein LigD [Verrucomicrobiaceae bacterium]
MPSKQSIKIDGREVVLSNLEKVYYPQSGFTKGEVIEFYTSIAHVIIPHLKDRPLTLKRFPEGVEKEPFYEKNAPSHTPSWVKTFAVPRSEGGSAINYILCNDAATLLWATNLADIEKHVLLARAPDLNRPTSIVFDLDPGEPAGILDCGRVALGLKKIFDGLNLQSFLKVSGSKGLHLTIPLNTPVTYEVTQPFAKAIAELATQQMPDDVVSEMAKNLRKGKVLIDWSQNSDFKTTVCVYAMRAKKEAPFISLPITWEELAKAVKKGDEKLLFFSPEAAVKRIQKLGDLFAPVLKLKQKLPGTFTKALAAGPPPKLSSWPRNRSKTREADNPKDKSLNEYAAKRDHHQTPEPEAKTAKKSKDHTGPRRFVIQKHEASHLHYDFRLEMEGVLRSWAVPKGPPREPRETRLAMHVEDHPMEYADFEGTIPKGNYGAGTVMVWDQGVYEDITGNATSAYYKGKLHIVMEGKKLKGEWILVKDRRDQDEGNRWLLIKAGKPLKLSVKADDTSVISGRSMAKIAKDNDAQWHSSTPEEKHRKEPPPTHKVVKPGFVEPMLCKTVESLPQEQGWRFEIKFDGYRCIAVKTGAKATLWSRNHKSLNKRFPSLVSSLESMPGDFTIDAEIVAMDEQGRPSFQSLQNNQDPSLEVYLYAFDLLNRDSEDLRAKPIEQRRDQLHALMESVPEPIRLSPLLDASADEVLAAVSKMGLEGVVGKRSGSVYQPGERSSDWIKHRTDRQQEFVIGGFIPGAHGFDDLLVGVYEGKDLIYAGQVKNGFVARIREQVFTKLEKYITSQCPFANLPETRKARWGEAMTARKMEKCRWIKPMLVCQVAFVEWTEGGRLRHNRFLGMREDKKPSKVIRES